MSKFDVTTDGTTASTNNLTGAPLQAGYDNTASRHAINSKTLDKDSEWVTNAFLLPSGKLANPTLQANRFFSTADFKFVDTRPGGSIGVNMRPGFTPYADLRHKGRIPDRHNITVTKIDDDYGMGFGAGRYWSETFDDPAQKIFITFGVPQFNSIANFLRKAFTYEELVMARRGVAPSFLYDLGSMAGKYMFMRAFPVATMVLFVARGMDFLFMKPNNKYFTLKPTMHQYWSAVNGLVNTWAVNTGMMPKVLKGVANQDLTQIVGRPLQPDTDYLEAFSTLFPEFFTTVKVNDTEVSRYIDAFAFANKAQRMANLMFIRDYQAFGGANDGQDTPEKQGFFGYLQKRDQDQAVVLKTLIGSASKSSTLTNYMADMRKFMQGSTYYFTDKLGGDTSNKPEYIPGVPGTIPGDPGAPTVVATVPLDINNPNSITSGGSTSTVLPGDVAAANLPNAATTTPNSAAIAEEVKKKMVANITKEKSLGSDGDYLHGAPEMGYWDKFRDSMTANFEQGSEHVCFAVDYTGPTNESFSASYGESEMSQKLNSIGSAAKEFRFAIGDGNIAGDVINGAVNAMVDLVAGAAESMTLGVSNLLLGLAGSGYIDIPKHWMSSSAQLPRMNYSMTLISPYKNIISQLQNIYMPFFMLLAGITPRSTGRSSYTAPFICQVYDRGRAQSQLCAMESLTVTRGNSNLGYSLDGKALSIEVSFTFIDLSSIMHMPVSSGSMTDGFAGFGFDDDNIITDYLAVLAGQDMYSQVYAIPRLFKRLAKMTAALGKSTSPHWMASFTHDKLVNGGGLFFLTKGVAKLYEGISATADGTTGPANVANSPQ